MRFRKGHVLKLAVVLLAATQPAHAQNSRAAPTAGAIDAVFARYDRESTPGCSVAVIDAGSVIFRKSYGMADPALGVPMSSSTTSWVPYSEARVFVAMAVAMLAEDGQITLDDPIRRHVSQVPEYAAEVTVRQLLHHTSGLADYGVLAGPGFALQDRLSEDEFFRMISRWGSLGFPPGQGRMYSNTDYALLKILVERVTGGTLHDFLAVRLLEPLGMTATRIGFDQSLALPGHALFHEANGDGFRRLLGYRVSPVGQISVTTNLDDIIRLDGGLRDAETGLASLLETLKPGASFADGQPNVGGYAFGVSQRVHEGLLLRQFQGVGNFTYLVQVVDGDLSVATLCNVYAGMDSFAADVARLYFEPDPKDETRSDQTGPAETAATPESDAIPVPAIILGSYVGEYRDPTNGSSVDVILVDDRLSITPRGRPSFPALRSVGGGKFETTLGGALFVLQFSEVEGAMTLTSWDVAAQESGGAPLRRWTPQARSAEQLSEYAGVYFGERVEVVLHIRADEEGLMLASSGFAESQLSPEQTPDHFRLINRDAARFERDGGGRVVAVTLDSTRVKGIRFTRDEQEAVPTR